MKHEFTEMCEKKMFPIKIKGKKIRDMFSLLQGMLLSGVEDSHTFLLQWEIINKECGKNSKSTQRTIKRMFFLRYLQKKFNFIVPSSFLK